MAWPVQSIMVLAIAWLSAEGSTASVFEGSENLKANHSPPRYVWFPVDVDETPDDFMKMGRDDQSDAFTGLEHRFLIHCWAVGRVATWALVANMMAALNSAATEYESSLRLSGRWLNEDNRTYVEHGNVFVLQVTVASRAPTNYDGTDYPTATVGDTETEHYLASLDTVGLGELQETVLQET